MNTKFKSLVVAVALAASGAASAAIDAPIASGNNGELFFNIWDPTVGKEFSFTMGLNTHMDAFVTAGMTTDTISFGNIFSNATYTTLFNDPADGGHNLSNLRWNVLAASSTASFDSRVMLTQALASSPAAYNNTQVESGMDNINNFLLQAPFNTAANEGGTSAPASGVYANNAPLGGDSVGGTYFSTTAGVGGNLGFYMFTNTMAASSYVLTPDDAADAFSFKVGSDYGTWNLSNSGELTYSLAGGPVVPVPAAVWLLGSALVGLVGVARRRETTAA